MEKTIDKLNLLSRNELIEIACALAVELQDASIFIRQAVDAGILNNEECAPMLDRYQSTLATIAK